MFVPVRTFFYPKKFQRCRELPVSGKVYVRKGQNVSFGDVIAEAGLDPKFMYLDLGQGLGVAEEEVETYLQVKTGSKIEAGDLIAGPVGRTRRVVRSPVACAVLGLERGRILLEIAGDSYKLTAGFPGSVVDLVADRGAVIESSGILIQGIWGNSRLSRGRLAVLAKTPQHVLAPSQLNVSLTGAIVLAGHCENQDALTRASDVSIGGLVLSSLNPLLISTVMRLPFPVMILEGFGKHPINLRLFQLLSESQFTDVVLNTDKNPSCRQDFPEMLILAPSQQELRLSLVMKNPAAGERVRITTTPYLGKMGTLVKGVESTRLPNGIWAETGLVRLDSGESLCLPLANLEIIEQI
jgi:hypothetical protein